MSEHHQKFEFTTPMAIFAAGIVIAGAILYTNAHSTAPAAANVNGGQLPANVKVEAPNKDDHIVGSLSAPVVLIEYSDFQCPYCNMVYPTIKSIVDSSGGKIAWVMRNYPLSSIHPQANPAANAAECIAAQLGSEGYFKFADDVFGHQSQMSPSYYAQVAQGLGVDMATYNSCVANNTYQNKIDAQTADAQNNGGQGTPFTVVYGNGKQVPIEGAIPAAGFQSVIDQVTGRQ